MNKGGRALLSLRARLINFMLQNRNLFAAKQKEDWNTYESILRFRKQVEDGAKRFGKLPQGISIRPNAIGELYAEWVLPEHEATDRAILYFHGGGYVSGTCAAHRGIVSKFVKGSGVKALVIEYRLAPEHPYPAALDDALTAYRWLLNHGYTESNIVFGGDSGGGGLALSALLRIRDDGLPLPAGTMVLSPYTDLACTGESYRTNVKKCLSPEGTGLAFGKHYSGGAGVRLPYVSPLYGELHGLPKLLIYCGGDETMRDDSVMFAEKARKAGVEVTLRVGEGLFHCYPAMAPMFPEATKAMKEICEFFKGVA